MIVYTISVDIPVFVRYNDVIKKAIGTAAQ